MGWTSLKTAKVVAEAQDLKGAPASVLNRRQPFTPPAAGLRNRRAAKASDRAGGVKQPAGGEKENVHPAPDGASPSAWRVGSDSADDNDANVIAMWERSVRDIFAALAGKNSNVSSTEIVYRKDTNALTCENFCQMRRALAHLVSA